MSDDLVREERLAPAPTARICSLNKQMRSRVPSYPNSMSSGNIEAKKPRRQHFPNLSSSRPPQGRSTHEANFWHEWTDRVRFTVAPQSDGHVDVKGGF